MKADREHRNRRARLFGSALGGPYRNFDTYRLGLLAIDQASSNRFNRFAQASIDQQDALLAELEAGTSKSSVR